MQRERERGGKHDRKSLREVKLRHVLFSSGKGILAYSRRNLKRKMASEDGMTDPRCSNFVNGPPFDTDPARGGQCGRGGFGRAGLFWRNGGLGCVTLGENFSAAGKNHFYLS